MASGLKETEELLYRLITAPGGVADGLERERGLGAGGLGEIVAGDERMDGAARVEIYANMYFYRLLGVLGEDFPATRAALGAQHFHNAVTGYLLAHPPSHFSISECGRYFADHLRRDPASAQFPYAADLARVECALADSFHAADAAPLDDNAMRRVAPADWPAIRMRTHPATGILDLEWRVADLLRAAAEDRPFPAPIHAGCTMLVWRSRNQAYYREIDRAERAGLALAARGAAFTEICAAVADAIDSSDPAARVALLLHYWLRDGVLIAD